MTEPKIHRPVLTHSGPEARSDVVMGESEAALPRVGMPVPGRAIRRSSQSVDIDMGSEEEMEEQEDQEEEEAEDWGRTAEEVAENIVVWLRENDDGEQSSNYTVAVLNSQTIYISKVNGVTAQSQLIKDLGEQVVENAEHLEEDGISLRLCQRYNTAVGSNHAEMCVLAAIGLANIDQITFFECTEASCDYCRAFTDHYNIINSSPDNDTSSQSAWAHPFAPWSFGTQIEDNHDNQVAQLRTLLGGTPPSRPQLSRAPAGKSTAWAPR